MPAETGGPGCGGDLGPPRVRAGGHLGGVGLPVAVGVGRQRVGVARRRLVRVGQAVGVGVALRRVGAEELLEVVGQPVAVLVRDARRLGHRGHRERVGAVRPGAVHASGERGRTGSVGARAVGPGAEGRRERGAALQRLVEELPVRPVGVGAPRPVVAAAPGDVQRRLDLLGRVVHQPLDVAVAAGARLGLEGADLEQPDRRPPRAVLQRDVADGAGVAGRLGLRDGRHHPGLPSDRSRPAAAACRSARRSTWPWAPLVVVSYGGELVRAGAGHARGQRVRAERPAAPSPLRHRNRRGPAPRRRDACLRRRLERAWPPSRSRRSARPSRCRSRARCCPWPPRTRR